MQRGKTEGLFDHFVGPLKDGPPKNTLSAFCRVTA
jgi:hypothetical protein